MNLSMILMLITINFIPAPYVEKPFEPGDTVQYYYNESYDKSLKDGAHKLLFLSLIRFYQMFISPAQGEVCNFSPSCSNYMFKAIKKYGLLGIIKGIDRLQRCNMFAQQYLYIYYDDIENIKGRGMKIIDNP